MNKLVLPKDKMLDILWESDDLVEDKVIGTGRWSVHHRIVFKHEGRFYQTEYSIGATESQDERPWEYDDDVESIEVHKVPKTIEVWEAV